MKHIYRLVLSILLLAGATSAPAQYYEISNTVSNILSRALSGSLNYKGYVEMSGIAGFGDKRLNFVGISTTHGFKYASWFYMGVGLGVDLAMSEKAGDIEDRPFFRNVDKKKVMIPLYSDFRFNIGGTGTGVFVDVKAGATWLIGGGNLVINGVAMTHGAQFYLRPSIGVRIPVSEDNRRAINIGASYQLITSNNFYSYYDGDTMSLNGAGLTISYEW